MARSELSNNFSARVRKLRQALYYSASQMGECFRASSSTYHRYELGEMFPGFTSLHAVANTTGVSLDWLVCGKGQMYFNKDSKGNNLESGKTGTSLELSPDSAEYEINELLEHIKQIPLLRHEILACFYKFKAEHKDLTAEALMKRDAAPLQE